MTKNVDLDNLTCLSMLTRELFMDLKNEQQQQNGKIQYGWVYIMKRNIN